MPLGYKQVRQSEQLVQLRAVIGQPAVANLLESEHVLDDVK